MTPAFDEHLILAKANTALRLVCAELPHLSALALEVRLYVDARVKTAAVTASGRIFVNPHYFATLNKDDATFVMAHELLHLALDTFHRSEGTADFLLVNVAHDLIINDMLCCQLGRKGPPGLLYFPGARKHSLEKLVAYFRQHPEEMPPPGWPVSKHESELGRMLREAGVALEQIASDVVDEELERQWFPEEQSSQRHGQATRVRDLANQARALEELLAPQPFSRAGDGYDDERRERSIEPQHGDYQTAWESALQRWLDAVAPNPRSYARPSRRAGDRTDVVLPGRRCENWTLHVVLDTSGSMWPHLPSFLGALAWGCRSVGVENVHLLQCDNAVTREAWLSVDELDRLEVSGFVGWEGRNVPETAAPPQPEVEEPVPPPPAPPLPPASDSQNREAVIRPYVAPSSGYVASPVYTYDPVVLKKKYRQSWNRWGQPSRRRSGNPKHREYVKGVHIKRRRKKKNETSPRPPKIQQPQQAPPAPTIGAHWPAEASPVAATVAAAVGYSESDLTPALHQLAGDPAVDAVIVFTDGICVLPAAKPPFSILWVLPGSEEMNNFQPPYGTITGLPT